MKASTQILQLNRFDGGTELPERTAQLVRRRQQAFGRASVLFYREPLEIVRAEGVYMYDAQGREYLDLYNNVPCVGHCHPRVAAAIAEQSGKLATNSRYLYANLSDYAETLLATFPSQLSNLVMTCSGSEANDIALRIAEMHSGAQGVVVTEAAYHGNTTAVMAVSPSSFRHTTPLPPHVRTIAPPGGRPLREGETAATAFANDLQAAIDDLDLAGIGFSALLVNTIFSSDGVYADEAGLLAPALKVVHESGGLFIADEVQPGFGRTGPQMWCFARNGIVPDVVTMGKPMGNGYPMAGVVTRPELLDLFVAETGYFNTFGANPVAAAAGLAVLKVLRDEQLPANAERVGAYLQQGLQALAQRDARISEVRGAGLFLGVSLVDDAGEPDGALASALINGLKEAGILIGAAGKFGNVLKIRPALCFQPAHADHFIAALAQLLQRG